MLTPALFPRLSALAESPLTGPSSAARRSAALLLAVLMLATRQNHFGLLTDASWAVFFLGGFYVGTVTLFALFMAIAIAMDYVATQHLGVSSYCLSPAYPFLLPSYATLWIGGLWTARRWHAGQPLRNAVQLALALWAATSVCFLISNGSFYWLSGRVAPTLAGWSVNLGDWYGAFLLVPFAYVSLAATAQLVGERMRRRVELLPRRAQPR